MTVTSLILHDNLSFADYTKLPGHSYSSIKADGREINPTPKMITGTMIHQYLLEPAKFTGDIKVVKPIATAIIKTLGPLYKHLRYEMSVSCSMAYNGFKMAYRGRVDAGIPKRIVIDFKFGEDIEKSKGFFGYDDQVSGYAMALEASVALLIGGNPYKRVPDIKVICVDIRSAFWEQQILLRGEAV
jgi:hypothetical protein